MKVVDFMLAVEVLQSLVIHTENELLRKKVMTPRVPTGMNNGIDSLPKVEYFLQEAFLVGNRVCLLG